MNPLAPCPSCRRHVRVTENACPFCHAVLPAASARVVVPAATQRLTRAAAFAFTASLTVAGCGTSTGSDAGSDVVTVTDSPSRTDTPAATDHPAATDTPAVTDTGTDTGTDLGNIVAAYGGPTFPDAALEDAGPPIDDGGIVAAYGGPTFPDSGVTTTDAASNTDVPADVHDGGSVMALYGAPVLDGGGGGLRYGAPPVWDV